MEKEFNENDAVVVVTEDPEDESFTLSTLSETVLKLKPEVQ